MYIQAVTDCRECMLDHVHVYVMHENNSSYLYSILDKYTE